VLKEGAAEEEEEEEEEVKEAVPPRDGASKQRPREWSGPSLRAVQKRGGRMGMSGFDLRVMGMELIVMVNEEEEEKGKEERGQQQRRGGRGRGPSRRSGTSW
jgi:hypothetical protein